MKSQSYGAAALLIAALALGGCAGLRAFPEAPFAVSDQLDSTKFAFEGTTYEKYYKATGNDKLMLRNQIINVQVRAYDIRFAEYEQSLFELGIGLGVGTDWATLALSGLTATVGGTTTKAAFGAINAGLVGAKGALDKHLFMEKTLPVIMTEMAAQRAAVLVQIRTGLIKNVADYGLDQGLSDLQRYARVGSIASALNGIVASSGTELKKNNEALNKLTTFKYEKDAASVKLKNFWMPDGKNIDKNNEAKLNTAMKNRGLATGPGRIPNLMTGGAFAAVRAEIVKDLGL